MRHSDPAGGPIAARALVNVGLQTSAERTWWRALHPSAKVLIVQVTLIGVVIAALEAARAPFLLPYAWHKWLHIVGGMLFLGNLVVSAAWMVLAARTNDAALVHFAANAVSWMDVAFTAPGIFLLLANGRILAQTMGGIVATSWLAVALGIFGLTGLLWAVALIPDQQRLIARTRGAKGPLAEAVRRPLRRWYVVGSIATILPLLTLVLMVLKPAFW